MADDHGHGHGDIIIIKKKVSGGHGHHGGAWKIAFADFMTAMMAFFLVLWIINATDKQTKTVIAHYFNPVKLENPAKSKKGVHGATAAPVEGHEDKADKAESTKPGEKENAGSPAANKGQDEKKPTPGEEKASAEAKAQAAEAQLFGSPYDTLDRLAGAPKDSAANSSPEKSDTDMQRAIGALSIDALRDPFKPIGPGSQDDPVAFDAEARNQTPPDLEKPNAGDTDKPQPRATPGGGSATPKTRDKSAPGESRNGIPAPAGPGAEAGAKAEAAKAEATAKAEAAKLEGELKSKVEAAVKGGKGPEIEVKQTKEGLLISLTDKLDFAMFGVGSAEPKAELIRAMDAVGKVIKSTPGHVVIRGHTDARQYRNGAYDNWRLSSDRAQMAYYMLTRGGAPAARFTRIEGYADRTLHDPAHPLSAVNRRLEILIESAKP